MATTECTPLEIAEATSSGQMYAPAAVAGIQYPLASPDQDNFSDKEPFDCTSTELRGLLRDFVASLVHGRDLGIVFEDGSMDSCKVSMTKDLQQIFLVVASETHIIEVKQIQHMFPGMDYQNIRTTMPLDQACLTLVLKANQCVTLRFDSEAEQKQFFHCMKILCLAMPTQVQQ
jgi:hypothetical protein